MQNAEQDGGKWLDYQENTSNALWREERVGVK